jgi:hypothetical protein
MEESAKEEWKLDNQTAVEDFHQNVLTPDIFW